MPRVKFTKKDILKATYDIMKQDGIQNISARKIANKFKGSTASLINRMETKKKGESGEISNSFYAEVSEGTPENVYRVFNEVVREYNNLSK